MKCIKVFFAAMFVASTALAQMKIAISDELKSNCTEYKVKGRQGILINQKLSFGEYQTNRVGRSWTKGNSSRTGIGFGGTAQHEWVNIISTEYINKKQTLNFSIAEGTNASEVFCVSRFHAKELQVGNNPNSILNIGLDIAGHGGSSDSKYYVQIFTNAEDRPWELVMDNQESQFDAKNYRGYLAKSSEEYYTIEPITKLEKKGKIREMPFGSAGFEIKNKQGTSVAAVSMMNNGLVFLGTTNPEERFLMANLCAALLLQEQID